MYGCRSACWRWAWLKEGSYGSQTRVSVRYGAIMTIDNRVHVSDARLMKVEASILYPSFDQTELRRKQQRKQERPGLQK